MQGERDNLPKKPFLLGFRVKNIKERRGKSPPLVPFLFFDWLLLFFIPFKYFRFFRKGFCKFFQQLLFSVLSPLYIYFITQVEKKEREKCMLQNDIPIV